MCRKLHYRDTVMEPQNATIQKTRAATLALVKWIHQRKCATTLLVVINSHADSLGAVSSTRRSKAKITPPR